MDFLQHHFVTSGVETYLWFPPLVAFLIAILTSTGGISGAFLILPFQISVLGFATPGVTATNFLYNMVGTPGGVYRYAREKRMLWPLAVSVIAGTDIIFVFAFFRTRKSSSFLSVSYCCILVCVWYVDYSRGNHAQRHLITKISALDR